VIAPQAKLTQVENPKERTKKSRMLDLGSEEDGRGSEKPGRDGAASSTLRKGR